MQITFKSKEKNSLFKNYQNTFTKCIYEHTLHFPLEKSEPLLYKKMY